MTKEQTTMAFIGLGVVAVVLVVAIILVRKYAPNILVALRNSAGVLIISIILLVLCFVPLLGFLSFPALIVYWVWLILRARRRSREEAGLELPRGMMKKYLDEAEANDINDEYDAEIAANIVSQWKNHAYVVGLGVRDKAISNDLAQSTRTAHSYGRSTGERVAASLGSAYGARVKLQKIQALPQLVIDGTDVYKVPVIEQVSPSRGGPVFFMRNTISYTLKDYIAREDRVATSLGVPSVKFSEDENLRANGIIEMRVTTRDVLAEVIPYPEDTGTGDLEAVQVGVTEKGTPAVLPVIGGHTVLVGTTNSGKGSVMWSLILGLKDRIKDGSVKLWGVDLKGGVELTVGKGLFDRMIFSSEEVPAMVAELRELMKERLETLRETGQRKATFTPENPAYLLVIDEAIVLTDGLDNKVAKQVNDDVRTLLTQGRAPGVFVFAALQDPTKEAFPVRDLFTRQIALRLRSEAQTRLALAVGSDEIVPAAHEIRERTPGVGFIRDTASGEATRFRAYMVSDEQIQRVSQEVVRI